MYTSCVLVCIDDMKWILLAFICQLGWNLVIGQDQEEIHACPQDQFYLYPCSCSGGGTQGVQIECKEANLAMLAVGLRNARSLTLQSLYIHHIQLAKLFGEVLHEHESKKLSITHSGIKTIEKGTLQSFNNSLTELILDHNELTTVPIPALSPLTEIEVLSFSYNKIVEIGPNTFKDFYKLSELRLDNNNLKKLHMNGLNNLRNLETLKLYKNEMVKFERNIFKTTNKLKYLDFSYNKFVKFEKTEFNMLTNLWFLNCSDNLIKTLPSSMFVRNGFLRVINISNNHLTELDRNSFRGLRYLRDLYARNNKIRKIEKSSFISAMRLRTLDFAHNLLEDVGYEMFTEMQWLEILDLSFNKITRMASSGLRKMYQVFIDLSHNNISYIGPSAFQELSNVSILDLSHNNIAEMEIGAFENSDVNFLLLNHNNITDLGKIPMANLTGIKFLNVTHNFIQNLHRRVFTPKKLYELHTVDLSYNNISQLSGSVFEKLASVRTINLSHNNLTKLGFGSFGAVTTLNDIDLSFNKIRDARGALSGLISLRFLNLSHNDIHKMFDIPVALNELNLNYNNLSHIDPGSFPMMNSLLKLELDYNNLTHLQKGSFSNLLTLQTLSLGHNNIKDVPWQALEDIKSLQYLYFHGNNITELDRQAFGNLPVVFHLRLDDNQINSLKVNTFEGMLQLITLNISNNNINALPPGVFKNLVSLKNLDLSYNQIGSLDNRSMGILDDLLSLEKLNLSHNRMSFVSSKTFPKSPYIPYKLRHVDLSHNFLTKITANLDDGMKRVEELSLKDNMIEEIEQGVLQNLTSLSKLDLSGNLLTRFGSKLGSHKNLTFVDLSRNRIQAVNVEDLLSNPLLHLNLSHNQLPGFYDGFLPKLRRNLTLYYHDNPLQCNCHLLPLHTWIVARQPPSWANVRCDGPARVSGVLLTELRPDTQLGCRTEGQVDTDVAIRGLHHPEPALLRVVWFVTAPDSDVAGFRITMNGVSLTDIGYSKREATVSLPRKSNITLCIVALNSEGVALPRPACTDMETSGASTRTVLPFIFLSIALCIHLLIYQRLQWVAKSPEGVFKSFFSFTDVIYTLTPHCQDEDQTVDHLLFTCPTFQYQRFQTATGDTSLIGLPLALYINPRRLSSEGHPG
ncbi:hypothetical protein LAZ67_8001720 [Cordylochernes scorpioides]|uniref:LRRCT domain-containing protein n=1 Tax=Cordylochernes scorpioides TaxID=51811 RepID=A0ABY6KQY5_9ARAC|nr:hypothetical protein LAZ67_8001720 [Cordylochernes scorpioides]